MYYSSEVEATGNDEGIVKDASKALVWLDRSQQSSEWSWSVEDPKQIEITERFVNKKLSKLEDVKRTPAGDGYTETKEQKRKFNI